MQTKKGKYIFLVLISLPLICGAAWSANSEEESKVKRHMYEQDVQTIYSLARIGNFNGLEKYADIIQSKWKGKDSGYYSMAILKLCEALSGSYFQGDRQYDLVRGYALMGLNEANKLPVEVEVKLVGYVESSPETSKKPGWGPQRKMDVEVRLRAWKHIQDAMDQSWNPDDLPLINVAPPPGTGLSAGASPENIKDPSIRAEYEAAIEKNRQKIDRYNAQSKLRRLEVEFKLSMEKHIIAAYTKDPINPEELKQLLQKYKVNETLEKRILAGVAEPITKEPQRAQGPNDASKEKAIKRGSKPAQKVNKK